MLALKGCSGSNDPARRSGRSGESDVRGACSGPKESGRCAALPAFGATSNGSRCNPSCLGGPHCPSGQTANGGGSCGMSWTPKPGKGRGSGSGNICVGGLADSDFSESFCPFGESFCPGSQALAESSRWAGLGLGANEADLRNGEATLPALELTVTASWSVCTGVYCPYLLTTSSSYAVMIGGGAFLLRERERWRAPRAERSVEGVSSSSLATLALLHSAA